MNANNARPTPKAPSLEIGPAVRFWTFVTTVTAALGTASLVYLNAHLWVHGQQLWLISRASALTAYLVVTVIVALGLIQSHPRNKDTWRVAKYILPWHQALVGTLMVLIFVHLMFTVLDPKSGVTFHQMWLPLHAKYHPIAMTLGAFGLYALLAVGLTTALRKWATRKFWLAAHRGSWIVWVLVFLHGTFGGTDTYSLRVMYAVTGLSILGLFYWRHWVRRDKNAQTPASGGAHRKHRKSHSIHEVWKS